MFLSLIDEPVLGKKRGLSLHLQPPGINPLAWLIVLQTVSSHLQNKIWILCLQLSSSPHSTSVKLLSLSLCNSIISTGLRCMCVPSGAAPWQGPVIPLPLTQLSSLVCAHTSHRHSSSSLPPSERSYSG